MRSTTDLDPVDMIIRSLKRIADLTQEEQQALRDLPILTRSLNAGQSIVHDGDRPKLCCLIVEGWAIRYKNVGEEQRQILSFHVPGDMPDLQSLHLHTMDHSVGALTKATVAFFPHDSVREVSIRYPNIGTALWRNALVDGAIFREWIVCLGQRSAYNRIAHLICELYLKLEAVGLAEKYSCKLPVKQGQLADAMGVSNVHINRALNEMHRKEIFSLKCGTLIIHDWDKLVRTAGFDSSYLHFTRRDTD